MKNISLWIIVSSALLFLISCSTDELSRESNALKEPNEPIENRLSGFSPLNESNTKNAKQSVNPYDELGKMHNRILDAYWAANPNPNHNTIEEVYEAVRNLMNVDTAEGTATEPEPSFINSITDIINDPENSLNTIISNSHLTNPAKTSLHGFIGSLVLIQDDSYEDIEQLIVSYEAFIMANSPLLNNEDKRVILITTAIARYSFYYSKRRKDKDWETSVGNIAAMTSGALDSSSAAIEMALVTEISQHIFSIEH